MTRQSCGYWLAAAALALALGLPAAGRAQDEGQGLLPAIEADPRPTSADDPLSVDSDLVTGAIMTEKDMLQYCVNISDMAREARYSIIEQKLDEKQSEIDTKLVSLDEKLKAIKDYVEIRERFQAAAQAQVVGIYETMRPDAAAKQLSELDTGMAAAIIMKLQPKVSSNILTEMRPENAAAIARYLTAAMQQSNLQQASR